MLNSRHDNTPIVISDTFPGGWNFKAQSSRFRLSGCRFRSDSLTIDWLRLNAIDFWVSFSLGFLLLFNTTALNIELSDLLIAIDSLVRLVSAHGHGLTRGHRQVPIKPGGLYPS